MKDIQYLEKRMRFILTVKQKRVADELLKLNGTTYNNDRFALTHILFPMLTTDKEIRRVWDNKVSRVPAAIYRKISRVWQFEGKLYEQLINEDSWYRKFSSVFPSRTSETLEHIKGLLLRFQHQRGYDLALSQNSKRALEANAIFTLSKTALWAKLSIEDQEMIAYYYGFDLPGENTRSVRDLAEKYHILLPIAYTHIYRIKLRLKELDSSLLLLTSSTIKNTYTRKRRNINRIPQQKEKQNKNDEPFDSDPLRIYRKEILTFPELDDATIAERIREMANGNMMARDQLFYSALRYVLAIASRQHYKKLLHDAGFGMPDVIQEGNLHFYLTLPFFSGTTRKELRSFTESVADHGIRTALHCRGAKIKINSQCSTNIRRINKAWKLISQELDGEPKPNDLASYLGVSIKEVQETLAVMCASVIPTHSLDQRVHRNDNDADMQFYYDIIADASAMDPIEILIMSEETSV